MIAGGAGPDRGFALLLVLWTLGLLALIGTEITSAGRTETRLASNLRAGAAVEAAADAAVHQAVFRLLQGAWRADRSAHAVHSGAAVVEVRVENESGKLNPNLVPLPSLRDFLRNLGLEPARAASLAAAIVDWRTRSAQPSPGGAKAPQYRAAGLPYGPSGRPYASLDELQLVLGMTPDLFARLKPLLSIYTDDDSQGLADSDPQDAPEESALDRGLGRAALGQNLVAAIRADASGPGGARFTRQAVIRLRADATPGETPFQVLTWDAPAP